MDDLSFGNIPGLEWLSWDYDSQYLPEEYHIDPMAIETLLDFLRGDMYLGMDRYITENFALLEKTLLIWGMLYRDMFAIQFTEDDNSTLPYPLSESVFLFDIVQQVLDDSIKKIKNALPPLTGKPDLGSAPIPGPSGHRHSTPPTPRSYPKISFPPPPLPPAPFDPNQIKFPESNISSSIPPLISKHHTKPSNNNSISTQLPQQTPKTPQLNSGELDSGTSLGNKGKAPVRPRPKFLTKRANVGTTSTEPETSGNPTVEEVRKTPSGERNTSPESGKRLAEEMEGDDEEVVNAPKVRYTII